MFIFDCSLQCININFYWQFYYILMYITTKCVSNSLLCFFFRWDRFFRFFVRFQLRLKCIFNGLFVFFSGHDRENVWRSNLQNNPILILICCIECDDCKCWFQSFFFYKLLDIHFDFIISIFLSNFSFHFRKC